MSLQEEESILQKSVIPNLLLQEFGPINPTQKEQEEKSKSEDDISVLNRVDDDDIENVTSEDDQNTDRDTFEITNYKRKLFKVGVDFRKTLGKFLFAKFHFELILTTLYFNKMKEFVLQKICFSASEHSFENLEADLLPSESKQLTSKHLYDLSVVLGAVLAFIKLFSLFLYK